VGAFHARPGGAVLPTGTTRPCLASTVTAAGSPTSVDAIALTFDDGPDADWTPRLLDVLAEQVPPAQVTFFPIARRAAAQPRLMERILAEGHAIGLHCDEHIRHSDRDAAWGRADTERALKLLSTVGVTPRLWRTPWGDEARWTSSVAEAHGLRIVGWTADTRDWRGDPAQEMFDAVRARLRPGAIVLAHDGIGPGAQRVDARETLGLVRLAARHARALGLQMASLT
jgi:peptidoglycan-N-acetylglucosamine deacetylase